MGQFARLGLRVTSARLFSIACAGVLLASAAVASVAGAQAASLSGRVVNGSTGGPVADARVLIRELGREATTDVRGSYRFDSLTAGVYRILVRGVGFSPLQDEVVVAANQRTTRDFILAPAVQVLDSVRVASDVRTYLSPALRGFEERRLAGRGGLYVGEAQLREADGLRLSTAIKQRIPGLHVLGVRGGNALASRRGDGFRRRPCFVDVYLDGVPLIVVGGEPIDVDRFNVAGLAGVEFYPGGATIPAQFNRSSETGCGVLLLWSRER